MKQSSRKPAKNKKISSKASTCFEIITAFPEVFPAYFSSSILGRSQERRKIKINIHNLRDFTQDKHRTIDDKPFGGGPGMILKIEPIALAIGSILRNPKSQIPNPKQTSKPKFQTRIILLSAKGKLFTQKDAKRLAKYQQLILICGHYEGVDERVAKHLVDEEISIGEYVLTGGELGAMAIVDAVSRLLPGVLGKKESLTNESFSKPGYLEYPQYTRPEIFRPQIAGGKWQIAKKTTKKTIRHKPFAISQTWRVPKILLSGNHKKIELWRQKHSKLRK
ncbi:MAG: tRNA (guanosine(37)-N1)-methyltransferase TrmD [Patescibacteria group bacterium]